MCLRFFLVIITLVVMVLFDNCILFCLTTVTAPFQKYLSLNINLIAYTSLRFPHLSVSVHSYYRFIILTQYINIYKISFKYFPIYRYSLFPSNAPWYQHKIFNYFLNHLNKYLVIYFFVGKVTFIL